MTDLLLAAAVSFCAVAGSDPAGFPFQYAARRLATVSAGGVRVIRVEAHAGTLRIEGRAGLTDVRASGTANASSCDALDDIKLVATRVGDTIVVRSSIPEMPTWGWNRHASLDMVLELPNAIALEVGNAGGDIEIRTVGKLTLRDGPGDVTVEDIAGPLRIVDGAGDLHIRNVRGSVDIDQDGEGDLAADDVTGTVHIGYKGVGNIHVDAVGGDLLIDKRGPGRLEYCNIKGAVRVPSRGRRAAARLQAAERARHS